MYPKHEKDLYSWSIHTAKLLRENRMSEVDFENVIEEIEALGVSEKHQLINRLALIISHLLKWKHQPDIRGHSWIYTIREQRDQAKFHLEDNPGLKHRLEEILERAYKVAVSKAAKDTRLDSQDFPSACPFTLEQCLDEDFYPE